jgi:hypothetical protein
VIWKEKRKPSLEIVELNTTYLSCTGYACKNFSKCAERDLPIGACGKFSVADALRLCRSRNCSCSKKISTTSRRDLFRSLNSCYKTATEFWNWKCKPVASFLIINPRLHFSHPFVYLRLKCASVLGPFFTYVQNKVQTNLNHKGKIRNCEFRCDIDYYLLSHRINLKFSFFTYSTSLSQQ